MNKFVAQNSSSYKLFCEHFGVKLHNTTSHE